MREHNTIGNNFIFLILGILFLVFYTQTTEAREVPFSAKSKINSASFDQPHSVYATDIDGDGDLDVLGAADPGNTIAWWENTNRDGSSWTERTISTTFNRAFSVYAADIDRDGDMDVLGAAITDNDISWWENTNGDGTSWTKHTVDGSFGGARSVYAADINNDGFMDILGAAYVADDIVWWENDGSPRDDVGGDGNSWTERPVDTNFDYPHSIYASDIDGDGDLDIMSTAWTGKELAWWENTDVVGTAWTKHSVGTGWFGANVYSDDIDNDGDNDLVAATTIASGTVSWWENDGSPSDDVGR